VKRKEVKIKKEFCKECSLCIFVCPKNSLSFSNKFNSKGCHPVKWNSDNCNFCGQCFIICPDNVIEIEEK